MTLETKPKGLTRDEEWAWRNSAEGSWQRRALVWAKSREPENRRRLEELAAQRETSRRMSAFLSTMRRGRTSWADIKREVLSPWLECEGATAAGKAAAKEREQLRRCLEKMDARKVFVRFGDAPPDGVSRNWWDDAPEGGLSVFGAWETPDGRYLVDPGEDSPDLIASWAMFSALGAGLPVYLAEGREVGLGSAGEPLLADFTLAPLERRRVGSVWKLPVAWRLGLMLGSLESKS